MKKIAVLGDSSQDLSFELASELGVVFLPYHLSMGGETFVDQVDISKEKFYELVRTQEDLKTGVPPAQEVVDKLEELRAQGYDSFLAIVSSVVLTGMANVYESIISMDMGFDIKIFDTEQIGPSSVLYVLEAAKLRDQGLGVDEILEHLKKLKKGTRIFAIFSELEYLVRGGRISRVKAAIGSFLNISPVLTIIDNEIKMIDKIRGREKSLQRLASRLREFMGQSKEYYLVIFQGDNPADFITFKDIIKDIINEAQVYIETKLTPVLGVHSGPKAVGVGVMLK